MKSNNKILSTGLLAFFILALQLQGFAGEVSSLTLDVPSAHPKGSMSMVSFERVLIRSTDEKGNWVAEAPSAAYGFYFNIKGQGPSPTFTVDAQHTYLGKVHISGEGFDWTFQSDPNYPLTFKVVRRQGYVYMFGRGEVTDNKVGKSYRLGYEDSKDTWLRLLKEGKRTDDAILALGWMGDVSAVPHILSILEQHRGSDLSGSLTMWTCATALARLKDPKSIPSLMNALKDIGDSWYSSRAAEAAAEAIALIGGVEAIEQAFSVPNARVRTATLTGLKAILKLERNPPSTVFALLRKAATDEAAEVRINAVDLMGDLRLSQFQKDLIQALGDSDPTVRAYSAWGLGELKIPSAIPHLVRVLDDKDPGVRKQICYALGKIGDVGVKEALEKRLVLEDDDSVKKAIGYAIKQISEGKTQ